MNLFDRFLLWALPSLIGFFALLYPAVAQGGPSWTQEIRHGELVLFALPVITAAVATAMIEPLRREWQKKMIFALGLGLLAASLLAYAALASQSKDGYAIVTACRVSYIVAASTVLVGLLCLVFAKPD